MNNENMARVVFAVVDDGRKLGSFAFGAQYCFKVDKREKFVIPFKKNDTNSMENTYPYGKYSINVSIHKAMDKSAIMPSILQSGTIDFEVKEGFVTRITAYNPKMTKMTVALGAPPKVQVDVTLFPEELYNS